MDILTRNHWFAKRDSYMQAARDNMATLRKPIMYPEMKFTHPGRPTVYIPAKLVRGPLERDHVDVINANAYWVGKARAAHDIAMGRIPVWGAVYDNGELMGAAYVR